MPIQFDYTSETGVTKIAAYAVICSCDNVTDSGFLIDTNIYWTKTIYQSDPNKNMDKISIGVPITDPAYNTLLADPNVPNQTTRVYNYLVTRTDIFPNAQIVE